VSADIDVGLVDEGHQRVNFAIVASGPNAASPHHEAGHHRIEPGDVVLCDFGGTMGAGPGYCSDITRCVVSGEPSAEVREAVRRPPGGAGRRGGGRHRGDACQAVDAAARDIIAAAGHGPEFVHRTGHGIGVEEHETRTS